MDAKEIEAIKDKLIEVSTTIKGLRIEVEAWRQHTGSAEHFMVCEIERLIGILNEISRSLTP